MFNKIESLKKKTSKDYKYNPNAKHIADSMNALANILKRVNKSSDVSRADIRNLIAEYGNYYKIDTKNVDVLLNDYISSEIVDSIN